ncbi:hypothetical protein BN59_02880 [Legionella massiliensis]|uniref:DUF2802 domain-containing protein n=1 Tax=Legionella massiliensis TaxID=1034943 RepID=A0A078KVW4_9GAMM|nr:DUF2802 domain-containing protein [Legionella massiliensis]CDZ78570.1 hypothetical protein BN59_02880 [Legionella massiliensis]CEE14308.1 hypothetical protein BN1094_02880 [Legionella massiliensis]
MIIVLSSGIVVAIIVVKTMNYYRRSLADLNQKIKALKSEMQEDQLRHKLLVNADLGFAKQIAEINRQLISMDNQLQALENKRDNDGGYQHALKILEMGGSKEEIINSCHLSQAEAELLLNLHAYQAVIKTHTKIAME